MSEPEPLSDYPGINRLHYFLCHVGMIVAVMILIMIFGPESRVMEFLTLPLMIMTVVLDVMRLRNTGVSQWFAFIRFLPLGNTLLGIFLLSAQTGWVETRRWDGAGRNILILTLSLLVVMLLLLVSQQSVPFWF